MKIDKLCHKLFVNSSNLRRYCRNYHNKENNRFFTKFIIQYIDAFDQILLYQRKITIVATTISSQIEASTLFENNIATILLKRQHYLIASIYAISLTKKRRKKNKFYTKKRKLFVYAYNRINKTCLIESLSTCEIIQSKRIANTFLKRSYYLILSIRATLSITKLNKDNFQATKRKLFVCAFDRINEVRLTKSLSKYNIKRFKTQEKRLQEKTLD